MAEKSVAGLVTGDVVLRPDHKLPALVVCRGGCYQPMSVKVTVLQDAEHGTETVGPLAGRPCIRVRGRREDTGAEGYMIFGPVAMVLMAVQS